MSKSTDLVHQILQVVSGMDSRLANLEKGYTSHGQRLGSLEKGQYSLEEGQHSLERKLGSLEKEVRHQGVRLDTVDDKLGTLETEVRHLGVRQESMDDKLDLILEALSPHIEQQTELNSRVDDHDKILATHNLRLRKLESR